MTQQVTDETTTGTVVETNDSSKHPALRDMVRVMALEAEVSGADKSDDFVMDVMENILQADSVEDIFAAQESGMISGKDFTARPFYLSTDGISIVRSNIEGGGLPFYALLRVTEIATGEEVALNCGGKTFMAVLHALMKKDYFDVTDENPLGRSVVIIGTPSPAGAYLSLKPFVIKTAKERVAKK